MDLHLVSCHMIMLLHWIAIILHLAPGVLNCNDDPPPPCCPDKDDVKSPCCNDEAGEYCCKYQVTWEIRTLINISPQNGYPINVEGFPSMSTVNGPPPPWSDLECVCTEMLWYRLKKGMLIPLDFTLLSATHLMHVY